MIFVCVAPTTNVIKKITDRSEKLPLKPCTNENVIKSNRVMLHYNRPEFLPRNINRTCGGAGDSRNDDTRFFSYS